MSLLKSYTFGSTKFPFLFGGTFIEDGHFQACGRAGVAYFPSFSEGLSLRMIREGFILQEPTDFPSFSEGLSLRRMRRPIRIFVSQNFPSFSEGLSLRN